MCVYCFEDYLFKFNFTLIKLEEKMAELANEAGLQLPTLIHSDDTIFEFVVNDKGQWEHWMDRVSIEFVRFSC